MALRRQGRAVHQLVVTLEYGDAITAAVVRTQRLLRDLGFTSEIFTDHVHPDVHAEAHPVTALSDRISAGDAVMYHLAIGSPLAALFDSLRCWRIIVYHNITPPQYFVEGSLEVARWLARGRHDLARCAPRADLVIADSTFNQRDALRAGARATVVVPPPVDLQRLDPRPAQGSTPPLILFVGRVAPNKRHDVLIKALAVMRATTTRKPQLALLGSASGAGAPAYLERMRQLVLSLHLESHVTIDGRRISNVELGEWYERADCFAIASEHEGFCVPAVEAMAFGLPIIAHAAGAIPETVGEAGVLLHSLDPLLWAGVLERVLDDTALRTTLIQRAKARLARFSDDTVRTLLRDSLHGVGITA